VRNDKENKTAASVTGMSAASDGSDDGMLYSIMKSVMNFLGLFFKF
jgi:hypothetical protein